VDSIKPYEEETRKLYDDMEQIWPNDNSWYNFTHSQILKFIYSNDYIFNHRMKILNAGSGGSVYNIPGNMFHIDITDKFIKELKNAYVASVEDIPFDNDMFDAVICVGSVINYCNALSAISEISRVMHKNSHMILEYERSQSGELVFNRQYGKSSSMQIYDYNGQNNHKIWLYSDAYIDNILQEYNLRILKNRYFHTFTSIVNHAIHDEETAGKFSFVDNVLPPFIKKIVAHNRILLCQKF